MGPMPWTINSEIYPLWARSTCTAISTSFNWIFNLTVSLSFLTLTEQITKYGELLTFLQFFFFCFSDNDAHLILYFDPTLKCNPGSKCLIENWPGVKRSMRSILYNCKQFCSRILVSCCCLCCPKTFGFGTIT